MTTRTTALAAAFAFFATHLAARFSQPMPSVPLSGSDAERGVRTAPRHHSRATAAPWIAAGPGPRRSAGPLSTLRNGALGLLVGRPAFRHDHHFVSHVSAP